VAKKILEEINVPWVTILSQVRAVYNHTLNTTPFHLARFE
jgi:hypothetical protein